GLAVEPFDREPLGATTFDVLDERLERDAQPVILGITERHERAAAALDEQRGLAAEEDDVCARNSRSPCSRSARPRERGTVGLRRVGGREDERLRLVALTRPQLAQALDRAGQRELRAAKSFDEVAAPAHAERLERAQLAIDRAV